MKRRGRPPHPDILTPREWEVLGLVESGHTNEEIASRLGISIGGAKFHVSEILGKLHLSSRDEAARWHRERFASVPLWVVLRDWLWASPLRAAEAVGASVVAVGLAGVTVLAIAVARGDTNEGPARGSSVATVVPPVQLESPLVALAPGTHSAPSFFPPFTFTVPDVMLGELFQHTSWLTERATEGMLALVPDTAENRARSQAGGYARTFVNVLPNIIAAAEDCQQAAAPGVGMTASEIVGALATRPGLNTGGPVAVNIGGLSGQQIDLSIALEWAGTCEQGGTPFVPLVYQSGFIWWGAEPGERWRIIVLDVAGLPNGMYATAMIVIYSADAAAWDGHLAASMAVVESFEFDTTLPVPGSIPSAQ